MREALRINRIQGIAHRVRSYECRGHRADGMFELIIFADQLSLAASAPAPTLQYVA